MKILFIGNRYNVLKVLLEYHYSIDIFALKESLLEQKLLEKGITFSTFTKKEKGLIVNLARKEKYDIIISNGCPFILPTTHKNIYNIHPTYLPYLRGKTPLNGVLFERFDFVGATMHRISSEIDGGNIIYQEKKNISQDLDLGLIYFLSFHLEEQVFREGWKLLISSNFTLEGKKMDINKGSYFNRLKKHQVIDFQKMKTDEILKRVKSFGLKSQGVSVTGLKENSTINKIYDAEQIINKYLLEVFSNETAGSILLSYDEKLLLKTKDGILKITCYE